MLSVENQFIVPDSTLSGLLPK